MLNKEDAIKFIAFNYAGVDDLTPFPMYRQALEAAFDAGRESVEMKDHKKGGERKCS